MTKKNVTILIIVLVVLDILAWGNIVFGSFGNRLELFFFDVGQGDSEMIAMPGNVKLLIDGGPNNGKAASSLGQVLSWGDRYIDAVVMSHMELDHFGGLLDVIKRYDIGVFIYNGRVAETESAKELMALLKARNVPIVAVEGGDKITHENNKLEIVSGQKGNTTKTNANESALVVKFTGGGATALFTGDVGKKTEAWLEHNKMIRADIIKIAHHGSKFSSTQDFLAAVHPKIAVIEVGKNSYGHPTKEVLDRIKNVNAQLFRTDMNGMVQLVVENGTIKQRKAR
jgi:competence protein ComEC